MNTAREPVAIRRMAYALTSTRITSANVGPDITVFLIARLVQSGDSRPRMVPVIALLALLEHMQTVPQLQLATTARSVGFVQELTHGLNGVLWVFSKMNQGRLSVKPVLSGTTRTSQRRQSVSYVVPVRIVSIIPVQHLVWRATTNHRQDRRRALHVSLAISQSKIVPIAATLAHLDTHVQWSPKYLSRARRVSFKVKLISHFVTTAPVDSIRPILGNPNAQNACPGTFATLPRLSSATRDFSSTHLIHWSVLHAQGATMRIRQGCLSVLDARMAPS